jgi:external thioesterase TEII
MTFMDKPQLFLFHFAGGNCYSYEFMRARLREFDVVSIELPGRGRRINEPLFRDFDQAALDVHEQLRKRLTAPTYLVYGHSMGAYLALRVSNLMKSSSRPPGYLIVSGNPGPGIRESGDGKMRYQMGRTDFINELKALGGVPPEVIENQELFAYFEPILRADFEVAEKNGMGDEPAIDSPLYAMMGSREEKTGEISNWGRFTSSHFGYEILEGDHFFIYNHPQRIARIIKDCYISIRATDPA